MKVFAPRALTSPLTAHRPPSSGRLPNWSPSAARVAIYRGVREVGEFFALQTQAGARRPQRP